MSQGRKWSAATNMLSALVENHTMNQGKVDTGRETPPARQRIAGVLALCAVLWWPVQGVAGQAVLHMKLGDPARRGREVALTLDGITDTATGDLITPRQMAARLADTGLLFIGENHTNMDFHTAQLRTIKALHEAGREVLIGLEMFPYTQQPALDHWNDGLVTDKGFVELAGWYRYWGYHWNYYRDIFRYARAQGIRLYAVNTPRSVVKRVRKKGFQDLSAEEAGHLPPTIDVSNADHQKMYRAFFDPGDALHMSGKALEGMYRAQVTWDATMGWNALQALKEHGGPGAIMVVLIGAGHVTFGLGAERQIRPYYDGTISSLIPVPVIDDEGHAVKKVRASYASFIWGLPEEGEPLYPGLGVSLMGSFGEEPRQIIQVSRKSVGQRAGFRVGDILLGIDGAAIDSAAALRRNMARYRWGDVAIARIRRDDREIKVTVPFRRAVPAAR